MARVIAAIVAGTASEAPVTKASATETAAMITAAKTVAMLLGTCSHTEFTVAQE